MNTDNDPQGKLGKSAQMLDIVEMVYDEKEREALAGYFGLHPKSTRPFVPLAYRNAVKDKSKWPVFNLRAPDGLDEILSEDYIGKVSVTVSGEVSNVRMSMAQRNMFWLQRCIVGCSNFFYLNSETKALVPVKFSTEKSQDDGTDIASKEFLSYVPLSIQNELVEAIRKGLALTEDEKLGLDS